VDLSVVIVSYNTRRLLEECLASIYARTREVAFQVIVVDNNSADGSAELVRAAFPQVRLICNSENRGFAAANNQGFRIAEGRYILMLNSDTLILEGALQKVVRYLDEQPKAAIAGCMLLNSDGSLQKSVRSFPTVWNLFCEASFLYRIFPDTVAFGRFYMTYFKYDSDQEVDWVSGAFLMFRRSILDQLDGLDEQYFMYTEETDFCYRAKQSGFSCWFVPTAQIIHHRFGSSTDEAKRIKQVLSSKLFFIGKHFSGFQRLAMKSLVLLGIAIRIVAYTLSGLLLMNKISLRKSQDLRVAMRAVWGI